MPRSSFIKLFVLCSLLAIFTSCKDKSKEPLTSVAQANSPEYTIGVEGTSSAHESITKLLPKAQIKPYPDLITAYFALQVGDIDALAYNEIILTHTFNDGVSGLTFIENDIGVPVEIVIGMNNHSSIPNLKGIINSLIDSLNAAGTLNKLNEHWNKNLKRDPLISAKERTSDLVLRIATSADVPPFSFVNDNQIVGIDIDLISLLEEKLNAKTVIFKTDRDKLVEAIKNNKADLIISAFNKTSNFNNDIDYSKPYYIGKTALVVRHYDSTDVNAAKTTVKTEQAEPQKEKDIFKLEDLTGKSIGVQTGTTLHEQVQQAIKLPQIQYFTHINNMIQALESNNLEAIALDYSAADAIIKHHPNLSILDERLNKDEFGIAMSKNSPLKSRIDSCIKVLKQKGEIQRIKDKWSKDTTEAKAIKQDWVSKDTLLVGTEAQYAPYEFYQSGEIAGIDIDIMYSIGKMLKKNIKFADMNFDVLIPSLVNEKTDLCIAAISITEERSNSIDFSIPYDKNESVIVVRTPRNKPPSENDTGFFGKIFQGIQSRFRK